MAIERYHLGCAVWSFDRWVGELYRAGTPKRKFLPAYASVFNAVEGNTTFYATPPASTVQGWLSEVPEGFRFCLKFPRAISHDGGLVGVGREVKAFMQAVTPLRPHLGPIFLQLPPTFTAAELPRLAGFLADLPADFDYAVEVRHPSFYAQSHEPRFTELLESHRVDRVVLDARVLHHTESDDGWIEESKRRKPRMPVRAQATGENPFVRIIGNDRPEDAARCIAGWADVAAVWLAEGRTPHIFLHSPDDFHAPRMCRMFHAALQQRVADVGDMPPWPAEDLTGEQLDLL